MRIKKRVLYVILSILYLFIRLFPIQKNRIVFVSLESKVLESDLKCIYDALKKEDTYQLQCVLMQYHQKSLKNNFMYMLNTIQQIWYINRSALVILNDNNYVVSNFKRKGVTVLQVWHATGAIKKFGNAIKREYVIKNYDYVITNSEYWKEPYSQAFNVTKEQVKVLGMPRVDPLMNHQYIQDKRNMLLEKYPFLQDKKVILYAPTFRGNIYQGFHGVDLDGDKLIEKLGDEYVFIYKLHPLLKDNRLQNAKYVYNMEQEETQDLFTITDILISDFSSIIFDFSLVNKPMVFYTPDLEEYLKDVGTFLDYKQQMPGSICYNEEEVLQAIKEPRGDIVAFKNQFFKYQDGQGLFRVIKFIKEIMDRC